MTTSLNPWAIPETIKATCQQCSKTEEIEGEYTDDGVCWATNPTIDVWGFEFTPVGDEVLLLCRECFTAQEN